MKPRRLHRLTMRSMRCAFVWCCSALIARISGTALRLWQTICARTFELPQRAKSIPRACFLLRFVHDRDHPADAEAILEHPEFRSPEGLLERHRHQSAFTQRLEHSVSFRFIRHGDREREAFEVRFPFAAAV